jgi:glycosyltransferase involved in cell wall biosynthesis
MNSISVVIPVYNRFEYLDHCLDSVFRQTRVPDEVLIVDDCSSHSITGYLSQTPFLGRVTVLRTDRNRRVSGARNWGWRHARGNLITFIDSDDLWEPYKTELQEFHLKEQPRMDGVYGAMTAFFSDGAARPWAHDRPPLVTVANALTDCNISVQTLMIRREVLERIGGFDETFGILDDQDIAVRLALSASPIGFLPDPPMARLRRHSQNYSGNPLRYFKEDLLINKKHAALMETVFGPGSSRVHLARITSRLGSRMRWMGKPARMAARLLERSAPHSRMPRKGFQAEALDLELKL